ncbi:hypothetical protein BRC81_03000 [Halobacteriales archaeon QS_1_68_20]|nr:MAG: hypothetical protein BRC81_03000 [Halobacteriales archaeon QS_1_68_20]
MTTTDDDVQHRASHQPDPGEVTLRESDGDADGVFRVRMPVVSTGEVRNEGDEPLTRDEVDGMRRQIEERAIGVFLDHGSNPDISGARYSATGKVGEWANPGLVDGDGDETLLEADAVLMDPDSLPEAAGSIREALAALKAQVERDMALSSSIGWRDDDGFAGGVDLMEASIVGIPADPRTTSQDAAVAMARAAAASRPDADPERLVEDFRAVVMGPDERDGSDTQTNDMTDDGGTQSGEEPDDETRDEQDGMDAQEYRESMLEMQRQQTETLNTLAEVIRQDDGDDQPGGDEEDEGDDEEDDEEPDDETQTVEVDGEELDVDDAVVVHREALQALREGGVTLDDVDLGDASDETDAAETGEAGEQRGDQSDDSSSGADAGWLE